MERFSFAELPLVQGLRPSPTFPSPMRECASVQGPEGTTSTGDLQRSTQRRFDGQRYLMRIPDEDMFPCSMLSIAIQSRVIIHDSGHFASTQRSCSSRDTEAPPPARRPILRPCGNVGGRGRGSVRRTGHTIMDHGMTRAAPCILILLRLYFEIRGCDKTDPSVASTDPGTINGRGELGSGNMATPSDLGFCIPTQPRRK